MHRRLLWPGLILFAASACAEKDLDADGDGSPASADCDDDEPRAYPGATEACDGIDNNCDGQTDEGAVRDIWVDADDDGYGSSTAIQACAGTPNTSTNSSDCDDADPTVHPKATELCNGHDDDCDGEDRSTQTWYADTDGDDYGDPATATVECDAPSGFVDDGTDCDDGDAAVNPAAEERCDNAVDDDCDEIVASSTDADGDGFYKDACVDGFDCDDADLAIHPDALEVCEDGIDSDCSGADLLCGFIGEYDLADASATLTSEHTEYDAGRLVEAGDVTGDGIDDILVATLYAPNGGGYVVPGPIPSGEATFEDVGHRIDSVKETAGASRSISIGDINGDGIGDIGFGSPYAVPSQGQYIVFGPITGDSSLADADLSLTIDRYDYCGHGSDIADIDGDGFEDAIVGTFWDAIGGFGSGRLNVQWGPLAAGAIDLDAAADVTITGVHESAVMGRMIRAGRDVDGDGIGDLVTNAVWDSSTAPSAGGVYVINGPAAISSVADADGWLAGTTAKQNAGTAFTVGDFDGDGLADVATWAMSGGVYIVLGPASGVHPLDAADTIIVGGTGEVGSGLGQGDVDGDDIDELVIGAPFYGGTDVSRTYLVSDPPSGTSDIDDIARASFLGIGVDVSGQGVAVGDVDADGSGDLLIGAPNMEPGGGVYVENHSEP